jgi:hypothetical protein
MMRLVSAGVDGSNVKEPGQAIKLTPILSLLNQGDRSLCLRGVITEAAERRQCVERNRRSRCGRLPRIRDRQSGRSF